MASPYLKQTPPTKKDVFRYERKIAKDFLRKYPEELNKIILELRNKKIKKIKNKK